MTSLYDVWAWWPQSEPAIALATTGDAEELAAIHGASFHRGWGAHDFAAMLAERSTLAHVIRRRATAPVAGFIVSRIAADEAEILTIAVSRRVRGRGFAGLLLSAHVKDLMRKGVRTLFLEVESENEPALKLYARQGFEPVGRRKGYYRLEGAPADAIMMRKVLPEI